MRRGEESRGGRGRRDGLAKQHLTWLRLQAVNFLKVMMCVYISVCICVWARLCLRVYALYMSKHFWRSEPAGSTVVSGAPALGDEADRIKTHHNTAVIFP